MLNIFIESLHIRAQIGVEHTSAGRRVELFGFELLQGQLSPFDSTDELPVVVVDISGIKESADNEVIDLVHLGKVVTAIAVQKPRAIAIDAVITPEPKEAPETENDQYQSDQRRLEENYFKFIDHCLQSIKREKGIPIFVGVGERTVEKPEDWLGNEKYKEMAATVIIPRGQTIRLPIWFKASRESEKLFSLSASLAKASQKVHFPSGLLWAVETDEDEFPGTERHLQEGMEYADALVNYSKLEAIQQNRLLTISETSIKESGEKFRDRIVILGDGTKEKAVDTFVVAGRPEPVPGVYLHASAAYTFAREPMYEFRFWVRLLLDFLLSLSIIGWVATQRYRHKDEWKIFHWHTLQNRLVLGFLVGIFLLAVLLVRYTGILWLDFLLVMAGLWLHPKIEKKFIKR